ncbi:MAG TPA: helix-turn-helix domain-containing protein [Frankiaceae bacterium]|nr:helix-turn-helix domain-containing protein [Frankiaceae bacterium]
MTLPNTRPPHPADPLAALCAAAFRDPFLRQPALAALRAHDARTGGGYTPTLRAFLDHQGAASPAAEALGVHVNTLRYRLGRIIERSGVDLHDADERLVCALELATWPAAPLRAAPAPRGPEATPLAVVALRPLADDSAAAADLLRVVTASRAFGSAAWCHGEPRRVYATAPLGRADLDAVEHTVRSVAAEAERAIGAPVVAGIGPVVDGRAHAEASRRHADAVVRVLLGRGGNRVARLDDVRAQVVLGVVATAAAGRPFPDGGATARLAAHDRAHGTAYVGTLRTYLDAFGDVTRAARAAYVHARTLRYRLARIEAIAGLSLDAPADRLAAHLTLRLRDLRAHVTGDVAKESRMARV